MPILPAIAPDESRPGRALFWGDAAAARARHVVLDEAVRAERPAFAPSAADRTLLHTDRDHDLLRLCRLTPQGSVAGTVSWNKGLT